MQRSKLAQATDPEMADKHSGDRPYRRHRPSRMTREQFVRVFGGVYEHSPWIAEATFDRGLQAHHDTVAGLAAAMAQVVDDADSARRLHLLRAHPDLAGALARRGKTTASSAAEQTGAGLDQCSDEEYARFGELNRRYRERFGFPFIVAVKGLRRAEILGLFERRIGHGRERELAEALTQVHRIAELRLLEID